MSTSNPTPQNPTPHSPMASDPTAPEPTQSSPHTPPDYTHADRGSAVPWILAAFVLLAGAYGGFKWWQVEQTRLDRQQAVQTDTAGPPITDFELTERSGETFRSADMRGKVWVATYFFTTCPGSCTRLNQNIKLLHNLPELADVTWVSITCDPDTDTLEVLNDYADRWQANPERWLFCRGDQGYINQIGRGMHLSVGRKGHQDYAVVFDKQGQLRGMFDATRKSDGQRLRALLLKCLQEEPPAMVQTEAQDEPSAG